MKPRAKLVVVVPDGTYRETLRGLFARSDEAGFGPLAAQIVPDPFHDSSGKLTDLLRPYIRDYNHALALRDLAGSGYEQEGASRLEEELETQMRRNGWHDKKCAAVVVEPEIEDWLRLPSGVLLDLLRDRARKHRDQIKAMAHILDEMLSRHGGRDERGKARNPKEVFEGLIRHYGIPPSNALYGFLAKRETIVGCLSTSFNKLLGVLRSWFPVA